MDRALKIVTTIGLVLLLASSLYLAYDTATQVDELELVQAIAVVGMVGVLLLLVTRVLPATFERTRQVLPRLGAAMSGVAVAYTLWVSLGEDAGGSFADEFATAGLAGVLLVLAVALVKPPG